MPKLPDDKDMDKLRYSNAIPYLLNALPGIRGYYDRRAPELYAHNNPHVSYGSIFVEYIQSLVQKLQTPHRDDAEHELKKAFDLIEQLSGSSDFELRCLAETSVLESLLGEPAGLARFVSYLGPDSKKLARKIAEKWDLDSYLLD
jgi:hypothetical protein